MNMQSKLWEVNLARYGAIILTGTSDMNVYIDISLDDLKFLEESITTLRANRIG